MQSKESKRDTTELREKRQSWIALNKSLINSRLVQPRIYFRHCKPSWHQHQHIRGCAKHLITLPPLPSKCWLGTKLACVSVSFSLGKWFFACAMIWLQEALASHRGFVLWRSYFDLPLMWRHESDEYAALQVCKCGEMGQSAFLKDKLQFLAQWVIFKMGILPSLSWSALT